MSKYYNPRIGAPSGTKPSAPKKKKAVKAKGGRGGPSKANIAKGNKTKKNPNSAPEKAKGGSKADIVKKSKEKNKSTQQNTNPSKAKGGKGGPAKVKENKQNKGGGVSSIGEPNSFKDAFKKARKEKGKDSTFTYKGKSYSTVTMDDVKSAGFNTLKEYLNSKKK